MYPGKPPCSRRAAGIASRSTGSDGHWLFVTPERLRSDQLIFDRSNLRGPVVMFGYSYGGTSGRWTVAERIGRYFPRYRGFIRQILAKWACRSIIRPAAPIPQTTFSREPPRRSGSSRLQERGAKDLSGFCGHPDCRPKACSCWIREARWTRRPSVLGCHAPNRGLAPSFFPRRGAGPLGIDANMRGNSDEVRETPADRPGPRRIYNAAAGGAGGWRRSGAGPNPARQPLRGRGSGDLQLRIGRKMVSVCGRRTPAQGPIAQYRYGAPGQYRARSNT